MSELSRRELLIGTTVALVGGTIATGDLARAEVVPHKIPWQPNAGSPPKPIANDGWQFFSSDEVPIMEHLVDRIIPPDAETPGGKDAGCVVFIDRQLAGPYGRMEGLYTLPPFAKGLPQQGPQSSQSPAQMYRAALGALNRYCVAQDHKKWIALTPERQDEIIKGLSDGTISLPTVDGKMFFEALLKNTQEGFFSDPLYGGNRDMCAWKMIGFPGAHYDYREWVGRHNERYPHPPVSIMGRAAWTPQKT